MENSLDAGAKSVEVRVWGHGADRLEVDDDGRGVPEEDFEALSNLNVQLSLNWSKSSTFSLQP